MNEQDFLAKAEIRLGLFSSLDESEVLDELSGLLKPDDLSQLVLDTEEVDFCSISQAAFEELSCSEEDEGFRGGVSCVIDLKVRPKEGVFSPDELELLQNFDGIFTPHALAAGQKVEDWGGRIGEVLAAGVITSCLDSQVEFTERISCELVFLNEQRSSLSREDQEALVAESFSSSRAEVRRLMHNRALLVNGERFEEGMNLAPGDHVQIGRGRSRTL